MCLLAESVELQVDRGPEFGERRRERSIARQPDAVRVEHNVTDAFGVFPNGVGNGDGVPRVLDTDEVG